jgi:prepilin-type N-terminal cleavage/methylation domain-containing protein
MHIQKQKSIKQRHGGFTLVEILVAIGILSGIIGLIAAFQVDVFSISGILQSGLDNQNEARKAIGPFVSEVRSASASDMGSYVIRRAQSNDLIFYSDINGDNRKEEIRYYLEDGALLKSVTESNQNPLQYNSDNTKIVQRINHVINENIFEYFDSGYDGASTTPAISEPIDISQIRMIKINLTIDSDVNEPPQAVTVTTQASIRNLKDNY